MPNKIKNLYNKNLFLIVIILLLFILSINLYLKKEVIREIISKYIKSFNNKVEYGECLTDNDCVPFECCHPSTCVSINNKHDCSNIFCTQECKPDTLDCNQGYCGCVNRKCKAVVSE